MPIIGPKKTVGKIIAGGMLVEGTPIERYAQYGLWVKREDLACPPPGPPFSKTRGVYARVASRPESQIGVLDTRHSQAGHAVARACQILGKKCINFFPVYLNDRTIRKGDFVASDEQGSFSLRDPQVKARKLGAELRGLKAGRSCILFHEAKKITESLGGYMMPNALKLEESVTETAKEVPRKLFDQVIIPISSGTIAAGVIMGFKKQTPTRMPLFIIHLGYSRSHDEVERYLRKASGVEDCRLQLVDENYAYKDESKEGETPPWPCNQWYDLKAFRWWVANGDRSANTLFWNIG